MQKRQIVIVEGEQPQLIGNWTVGEVLSMARQLALWIESMSVSSPVLEQDTTQKNK